MLLAWLLAFPAQAQLGVQLPGLPATTRMPLPTLPVEPVTRQLDTVVNTATTELNTGGERLLRAAQIRELLRVHADVLEADPNGAPILRSQVLAISPSPPALQAALAAGFVLLQEQSMAELNLRIMTLQAPPGLSTRRALRKLQALDRDGSYDYNHVYLQSGVTGASSQAMAVVAANVENSHSTAANANTRVGLIDGGVDTTHPVFQHNQLHTWGCDQPLIPSVHGTAVASLLAGQLPPFMGAAPGADLYAADVYCGQPIGGSMTRIAAAMTWLAQQQVAVINISLVGPDNALLKQLVRNLIARGHLLVAAVGNDGPAAPPLYPAAYPEVVAVTAVDARDRVLVEAGRGNHVDFAAPGADMAAATLHASYAAVRGTSFAAPLVAGLLAAYIKTPQPAAAMAAIAKLAATAHDAGSRGSDKVYGNGVVGEMIRTSLNSLPVADKKIQ